jgi:hypothetical protein
MGPSSTLITTTHDGSDTYRPVITFADKVTLYGDSSPSQSTDIYAVETIPRYILMPIGTFCGHLVHIFSPLWYFVARKIW